MLRPLPALVRDRRIVFAPALFLLVCVPLVQMACSSSSGGAPQGSNSTGAGGSAGAGGGGGGSAGTANGGSAGSGNEPPVPVPGPGEVCGDPMMASYVTMTFSPLAVYVAPGKSRHVKLSVAPDFCSRVPVTLSIDPGNVATIDNVGGAIPVSGAAATQTAKIDLTHPTVEFDVIGVATGTATLTATLTIMGQDATLTLPIDVRSPALPTCSGMTQGTVSPGSQIGGSADVAGASLGLQAGADMGATTSEGGVEYATSMIWPVSAFPATVACSADIVPDGYQALGPAITFGPESATFPREIPMAIPIEPAAFPDRARLRHLRVAYSGPAFKAPRTIPVADPHIDKADSGSGYVLKFLAPRLGTYQAVIKPDAGTHTYKRHIVHRAILGVSMGGGGTATFGLRHHDLFDVLAPLGGPSDWSWMLDSIEKNQTGGFPANDGTNVPSPDSLPMPKPKDPYEHPSQFNQWWYEYPRTGNGGTFARGDYTQIFRDLALQFGNPNSQNDIPDAENLPRGVDPTDKSVAGNHPPGQCQVWVDPIDKDPNQAMQQELANDCPIERCANTLTLTKYYDAKFNPKGTWPVITVCDGGSQDKSKSPWANQFNGAHDTPLEVALAVDYNGNGIRDANEPIIQQGHEPWQDVGTDGVASADESGYAQGTNDDPAGDDYSPQYNPNGTEGDARYQVGEPYDDFGIDGVQGTASSPYDLGEGDGTMTITKGAQTFYDRDSRSILHQWSTPPGGVFDDTALHRIDLWTDGGTRDLFNFHVDAQHLVGSWYARGRDAAYFTGFDQVPGQTPGDKADFYPQRIPWEDLQGVVLLRYGAIDPTKADLDSGSGQHVGTANEILFRLQSAFYFAGQRWPDAPRVQVESSASDPVDGAQQCEIKGSCTFDFTDSRGRVGPVTISLPPGYANKSQQGVRFPVYYVLHGYGQTPEDLGPAVVLLNNWMNSGLDSSANRLPRAIAVYVDGRCRIGPTGKPECIRGSFYVDSPRESGGKAESFFLDLIKYVDQNYRTMGPSDIDWTELAGRPVSALAELLRHLLAELLRSTRRRLHGVDQRPP